VAQDKNFGFRHDSYENKRIYSTLIQQREKIRNMSGTGVSNADVTGNVELAEC